MHRREEPDTLINSESQGSGSHWVQITEQTRLRASALPDREQPVWEGSRFRRKLLIRRSAAILVIGTVTALLGWSVIAGIHHATATYTTIEGTVTAQTESPRSRTASCQLDMSYTVDGQELHGVAKTNAYCNTLPPVGSHARINVASSDPHDIWLDGIDDAGHPNPVLFAVFLVVAPLAIAFALWTELTDFGAARKLVASGVQWRKFRATVVSKSGGRAGVILWLKADGVSGEPSTFGIFYRFASPVGPVRKGDSVELSIIADGQRHALLWRPEIQDVDLIHTNHPPAFVA